MRISAFLVTTAIIGGVVGSTARAQTNSGPSTAAPTRKAQTGSVTPTASTTMKARTRIGRTPSFGKAPEIPGLTQRNGSNRTKYSRRIPPAPPPPPVLVTRGSRQATPRKVVSANEMFVGDSTGRTDLAGHPVPFYPSTRSLTAAKSQKSAVEKKTTAKAQENGAKVKDLY